MVRSSIRVAERYVSDGIVESLTTEQIAQVITLRGQGVVPHLGVVMAEGQNFAADGPSASYVARKVTHGKTIGAESTEVRCGRWVVSDVVTAWSADSSVHGVMVQLPLPSYPGEDPALLHKRTAHRLDLIAPEKDVDGLRPNGPGFAAATPAAIMRLLREQTRIPLDGNPDVLVVGSEGYLVGRHMAPLLKRAGIVPVCHDKALYTDPSSVRLSEELRAKIAGADIIVSCAGVPGLIQPDMLHDDMVVIDAGLRMVNGQAQGDLHPSIADSPLDVLYTAPTRGVGPLTVCELWQNTINAAMTQAGRSS